MAEEKKQGIWSRIPWPFQMVLLAVGVLTFLHYYNMWTLDRKKEEFVIAEKQMKLSEKQLQIDQARAIISSVLPAAAAAVLQTADTFSCETLPKLNAGFEAATPQRFTSGFQVPHGCAVVEIGFRVTKVEGSGYEIRLPDVDPPQGMPRSFFPDCGSPQRCAADLNMSAGKRDRRVLIITRNGGSVTVQP